MLFGGALDLWGMIAVQAGSGSLRSHVYGTGPSIKAGINAVSDPVDSLHTSNKFIILVSLSSNFTTRSQYPEFSHSRFSNFFSFLQQNGSQNLHPPHHKSKVSRED